MNIETIVERVPKLAEEFASGSDTRRRRTDADPADFQRLAELGVHMMAVPTEFGGTWESLAQSTRPVCTVLRTIAKGDPSVALVSTMHPLVVSPWRISEVPKPFEEGWRKQRREVFETVNEGAWWGTIISEPGSGGDMSKTASFARPQSSPNGYILSGQKHFGSGSGVTSFMITAAIPEGEHEPDGFFMDVRNVPWDGSAGMKLSAKWAGHGMMSTNSHAFEFSDFPATRMAWPGHLKDLMAPNDGLGGITFCAVIIGVVDAAMDYTRQRLERGISRGSSLRAYQQVEWTKAEQEAWLIDQAFEGALRVFDQGIPSKHIALLAKESIADLAETVLGRLCRLSGGAAYTWYTPLGAWYEDVRALGYLRPPWALAFDQLFELSWPEMNG